MKDDRPDVWRRLFARVTLHDASSMVAIAPIWVFAFGAADLGVLIIVTLLRMAWSQVMLRRIFAPLRRWQDHGEQLEGPELLAVDLALQHGPRRFANYTVLGICAGFVVATILALVGIPHTLVIGHAELLMAGLMLVAIGTGNPPMLVGLIDPILLDERARLGAALAERQLDARRQQATIVRVFVSLNVMYALSVFYGYSALAGIVAVHSWRATGLAEQRRVVEHAALEAERSRPLAAGLEIVDRSELPALLLTSTLEPASVAALDIEGGVSVAAAPIGDGRWVVAQAPTQEHLLEFFLFTLVAPLFFAVPLGAANRSQAGSIARQLAEVRAATQRVLGGGQIGGIGRFAPPHNDEVGMLIRDFNEMLDVFEELANAAHSVSKGDLTITLERPGDLHDAFRGMLAQLQQMVGQLRATASKQAEAAAELKAVVSEQEQMLAHQSRSANEIAATVDVLASAAQEIAGTARGVLQNAEQTLLSSATVVTKITELGAQTRRIEELLAVIREIADRSDLLALNGALEATRAGDAGRGFALVAAEMRRLAERVTRTVVDVRESLTNIEHARADTVMATQVGRQIAEHTATAAREISALTAAQGDDTRRASDAMIDVAKQVIATATTTSQTRAAAGQLELHAAELERLTRQFDIGSESSG